MTLKTRTVICLVIAVLYLASIVLFFFSQLQIAGACFAFSTLGGIAMYLYGVRERNREEAEKQAQEDEQE